MNLIKFENMTVREKLKVREVFMDMFDQIEQYLEEQHLIEVEDFYNDLSGYCPFNPISGRFRNNRNSATQEECKLCISSVLNDDEIELNISRCPCNYFGPEEADKRAKAFIRKVEKEKTEINFLIMKGILPENSTNIFWTSNVFERTFEEECFSCNVIAYEIIGYAMTSYEAMEKTSKEKNRKINV